MRLGRVVDFKSDVVGTSRRSGRKSLRSESDIWRKLPEGTCWFACHLEPSDIEKIFVYADREWKEAFGTFNLNAVGQANLEGANLERANLRPVSLHPANLANDQCRHEPRIERLMHTLATGHKFRSLALTAFSAEGPFVVIDGSHRAAAMLRLGILAGQSCYVGFHQQIGKDHAWFRYALCGNSTTLASTSREGSTSHEQWTSAPVSLHIRKRSRRRHSHHNGAHSSQAPDSESADVKSADNQLPGSQSSDSR
jgi:uncharacterized protein YjbI with pentapeptide repeats